jgi:hypothetical protein
MPLLPLIKEPASELLFDAATSANHTVFFLPPPAVVFFFALPKAFLFSLNRVALLPFRELLPEREIRNCKPEQKQKQSEAATQCEMRWERNKTTWIGKCNSMEGEYRHAPISSSFVLTV